MVCSQNRHVSHPRKRVYRSVRDRFLTGVCGGLGQHAGISSTWIRVGFVLGFIIQPPVALVAYVIASFVMPKEEGYSPTPNGRTRLKKERTSIYRTREEAFEQLKNQFDSIERKVRQMEDYVTSKDYILQRKFEEL